MATAQFKFTCDFADGTQRSVNVGTIKDDDIPPNIKTMIKNFNDADQRAVNFPNFDNAFISDNGGIFKRISKAQLIVSQRTLYT